MRNTTISLDGIWRMGYCDIGARSPGRFTEMATLPYRVPGDVHTPLIEGGLISEPLQDDNSLACRWVEDKEFWCSRSFRLDREALAPVMRLTFEGLDTTADVYLNGTYVGRHENAFVEVTWDVSQLLHPGENTLLVRIDQGLVSAQAHDLAQMETMWNNEQPWRVWMRKPQYVYGWDWTIWLPSCGIWRSVYLTAAEAGSIQDVYARVAESVLAEGESCNVSVSVEAEIFSREPMTLVCTILDAQGNPVATHTDAPASCQTLELTIPNSRLWWCNGMGEPYLYTLRVSLLDRDGSPVDCREQRLGLRSIRLIEPALPEGETGFTFLLNGVPVFCKGANHVPCDCLPGRITPEKERRLIALTRDSGMNMLRIWGGGVYASETLMDACDESGILIWHDFMYACGYYPDHDPGFVENITTEARKAIRRLRRHTSLIGWAGNNEIQEMYLSQKQWNPDLPWYGGRIYEEILPGLVKELCPTLIYRPSSPFGGTAQADCRHGDQHIWLLTHVDSHPHYLDLWHFTDFRVKFFSEFGVMGAMPMETAQSCISPEHMCPDDPVWLHHTNSCQNHGLLGRMVQKYFGTDAFSPQQFILRSQAIQAELTRHIYEEFRRQKFTCSGLLFWTLSDSYGVHNWSLIDFRLRTKPVYHALKAAMAPLALCIRGWDVQTDEGSAQWPSHWKGDPGTLEIWGMNDTRFPKEADLSWTLMTLDGKVLLEGQSGVHLGENQSIRLTEVDLTGTVFDPADAVLRARLTEDGQCISETKYFFAPFARTLTPDARIHTQVQALGPGRYALCLMADRFVWMLHLAQPEGTEFTDNDFDLWPGEEKTVIVTTSGEEYIPVLHRMGTEA